MGVGVWLLIGGVGLAVVVGLIVGALSIALRERAEEPLPAPAPVDTSLNGVQQNRHEDADEITVIDGEAISEEDVTVDEAELASHGFGMPD